MSPLVTGAPEAHVSLSAIRQNYRRVLRLASPARVICVVKADGYGHGALPVAAALAEEGADFFAVARIGEALALRSALPRADILILGQSPPHLAPLLSSRHLIQTVGEVSYARALSLAAREPVRIHLKLDVGMGRLGISLSGEPAREAAAILSLPHLAPEGLLAHLPTADDPSDGSSLRRIKAARLFAASLPLHLPLHALASAGILRFGALGMPLARTGILLYGYAPSPALSAEGFLPAMRLYAPIMALRTLRAGDPVGYGSRFIAPRTLRAATLGIGYADGLPRALSGASLSVGGLPAPILGRICMDMTVCALPDSCRLSEGDLFPIFGQDKDLLPRLSLAARTIPYELLSALTARVSRIAVD